ncbi:MAG: DUF2497 domain-containing protein [Chelatococcus sp.]|nr:MAG: DUF2497 domain-containing protein [Chelatococcus sp.]
MSAQPKPNEPSMEEILASIRRIISDDEAKPADAPEAAEPQPEPEPQPVVAAEPEAVEDDVLDLGTEAALVSSPEPAEPASSDIEFLELAEPEPVVVAPPPPPPPAAPLQEPPAPAAAAVDMSQMLSDQASSAVASAFGQLAHTVLSNNARTLEDLVKDMLRPMLKTWLDDNLPTMVERLVRAEIERVARGGRS